MLTEKAILAAKPKDKVYRLADRLKNGLSLQIQPTGTKLWRLRYTFRGAAKMISLGAYPAVSLKEAREKAQKAREDLNRGFEPKLSRNKFADGETFLTFAKEWYRKFSATSTEKYAREVWSRLDRDVLPYLGELPIREVLPAHVLAALRRIESRGTITTMYKVKYHISCIMKYAIASGFTFQDPTRDLSPALVNKRSTPLPALTDPVKVGRLMKSIYSYPFPLLRYAMILQALTFVRPGELRYAQWEEFDLPGSSWRIPAERMKMRRPHFVPLSRQALEVLGQLRDISGGGIFLFPSLRSRKKPISDAAVNAALRFMGYPRDEMTGHGFRAMADSLLSEMGWSMDAIEKQLAHAEKNKVRASYHRSEHLEERRKMMQAWADYLDHLIPFLIQK